MDDANIVLTGFMGTGKSTVGRRLADRLGRPFIDVDEEIAVRAGASIDGIFAERGEVGFRALERAACRRAARRRGAVVATGGGALVDPDVREAVGRTGTIICLTCKANELERRLDGANDRPLLGPPIGRRRRIERLLGERADAYAALPHHIDTTARSPEAVVDAILGLLSEVALPVRDPAGTYDVRIGLGGLDRLGDSLRAAGVEGSSTVALITNPIVRAHHGAAALGALRAAGYRATVSLVPDGERHKRLATVEHLCEGLAAAGIDRRGVIVALGGGVTTDLAGFAAATYLRGIRIVQVPTTLLAMVDASVGGKTGVNLECGKNLVGAFWPPRLVVIDPRVLQTLPEAEIRSGVAEAIKHGVVGDPGLFEELSTGPCDPNVWWSEGAIDRLVRAVRVKIAVVEQDPVDRGRRAVLNLGHTVGHAIEAVSRYRVHHGEAVAIGLTAAARIAVALGEADDGLGRAVESTLARWGLPIRCPALGVDRVMEAMRRDKKRIEDRLRWVLPRAIGEPVLIDDVPDGLIRRTLVGMGARRES